ncbi:sensor histidine kinase [Chloroflexota bacterium]
MPIRWRLTLYFALVLCAILGLAGTLNYTLLQSNLTNQLDSNLEAYSEGIRGTVSQRELSQPLNYDAIESIMPHLNEFVSTGIYVQVIDRNGYVVAKSDSLGGQELPVSPSLIERGFAEGVAAETVPAGDGAKLRIMVSPLHMEDETLLLEVAQPSGYIDATMNQARWIIIVSIMVALVLSIMLGRLIFRGALSPVSQLTQTARSIENGRDLSRRVGYRGPMDEIGQLASTFDHMIERLDRVFKSQEHFVADASHELRSPLTVIRGNLDLIKRSRIEAERRESLKAIESETARMTKVVKDLLSLAETDSGRLGEQQTVPLKEVLSDEMKRAQTVSGSHKIVTRHAEDLTVKGDKHRLRQLLGNLIDNAIRHTPEDGTISLSLYQDGEWARLEVEDTGVGIPDEELPHIFNRFHRVDKARSRERGGAGLGLALVKQIAEQHEGMVAVKSMTGRGSTFTVWLKL